MISLPTVGATKSGAASPIFGNSRRSCPPVPIWLNPCWPPTIQAMTTMDRARASGDNLWSKRAAVPRPSASRGLLASQTARRPNLPSVSHLPEQRGGSVTCDGPRTMCHRYPHYLGSDGGNQGERDDDARLRAKQPRRPTET